MPIKLGADHIAAQQGGFEPQRQNTWDLEIYELEDDPRDIISLALASCPIPKSTSEEIVVPFGNEEATFAGRTTWENLMVGIRDYVDVGVREAFEKWRNKVRDPETGQVGYAKDYKKSGKLILCGPDGESHIREYDCVGMWPTTDPGGTLDRGVADQVLMEVTIRIQRAVPSLPWATTA